MRYVLADDLTGACDAALAFAKRGSRARVWLDASGLADAERDAGLDVLAIDLDSRERSPEIAARFTTNVLERLRPRTPAEIVKKIDSTLRGNVASETTAILAALPDAIAIVAPSYPAQGRTIRDGYLFAHGRRIDSASPREVFAGVPTIAIGLTTLRADGAALAATMATLGTQGKYGTRDERVAIADAETDADLVALVHAARTRDDVVWVGSAGIVEALAALAYDDAARAATRDAPAAHTVPAARERDTGRVLYLIGSRTATSRAQIADFAEIATIETLATGALLRGEPVIDAAIARAADALDRIGVALVAIGDDDAGDERAARTAFVAAVAPLVRDRIGLTVVLSGGATARAFCDAFGIVGLDLADETAAGTPRSRAIGAPLWIVTKAGGFGTSRAYREVLATVRERSPV